MASSIKIEKCETELVAVARTAALTEAGFVVQKITNARVTTAEADSTDSHPETEPLFDDAPCPIVLVAVFQE